MSKRSGSTPPPRSTVWDALGRGEDPTGEQLIGGMFIDEVHSLREQEALAAQDAASEQAAHEAARQAADLEREQTPWWSRQQADDDAGDQRDREPAGPVGVLAASSASPVPTSAVHGRYSASGLALARFGMPFVLIGLALGALLLVLAFRLFGLGYGGGSSGVLPAQMVTSTVTSTSTAPGATVSSLVQRTTVVQKPAVTSTSTTTLAPRTSTVTSTVTVPGVTVTISPTNGTTTTTAAPSSATSSLSSVPGGPAPTITDSPVP